MNNTLNSNQQVAGDFVTINEERFYAIENVDKMAPFFISVVSNSDHWLFVSSTGGLTAGRVSPDTALFPYETVDRIHDSALHTGSKTLVRITDAQGNFVHWEPFNREQDFRYNTKRNLYKNVLGNKLCFEEVNYDLNVAFRYTWATSEEYGFVRLCELENLSDADLCVEIVDGLQNLLPGSTPRFTQTQSSNLVDAYKWSELEEQTGAAFFTLYSGITDRAEPCESLRANTLFCLGLDNKQVLLSNEQIGLFKANGSLSTESKKRGIRGAYLVNARIDLPAGDKQDWSIVANIEMSQANCVELVEQLQSPKVVADKICNSIEQGSDDLARIMAATDGLQVTAEEEVSVHHYANVLFNAMRGGIFDDQYQILASDFSKTIRIFNQDIFTRHQVFLESLPAKIDYNELLEKVVGKNDPQLERLCREYMPISFGRRHGDPSRPWNQFVIKLKDDNGDRLLTYQGNWRDIFQNWEAITFSYPEFVENVIAKFVNASTIDGYNPYRITKEGIDWEVEDPEDPWSYIGYWGDHQIIYLQKMLELSLAFHPEKLSEMLRHPIFSYANVPYRIKGLDDILVDAKDTVFYDNQLADKIEERVAQFGADGKLVLASDGNVYQVNLLEKLLVALLSKLGNFVVGGGIWLNTQRPEWNDANNALVGQGLSMVTLCYLRRYVSFMQEQLANEVDTFELSSEVNQWLTSTKATLATLSGYLTKEITPELCYQITIELGQASSDYRQAVYQQEGFAGKVDCDIAEVKALLTNALAAIDHSIALNKREDNLYEAYNLLKHDTDSMQVDTLYQMLEGQVAVLSSGALSAKESASIVETLFSSDIYREDQDSFILYPDRKLPTYLEKGVIGADDFNNNALLTQLFNDQNDSIALQDASQTYRFHSDFKNVNDLKAQLNKLPEKYATLVAANQQSVLDLYENVFNHNAFTGRSGGMFGFEGLGSIYWHMVSKLLLAVKENFAVAAEQGDEKLSAKLGELYYRVRQGIGFNKTPEEYGAFPTDPYSHTPGHAGAKQPGMTGQVKEEVLTRFAELGVRVEAGKVSFAPNLLRASEFIEAESSFKYLSLDNEWQQLLVPENGLAYTWCQTPIVYQLTEDAAPMLTVYWANGAVEQFEQHSLSVEISQQLFLRTGKVLKVELQLNKGQLLQ